MYLIKTVCYSDRFLFFTFFSLLVVINRWNRDSGLHSVLSVLRFHGFFRAGKITEGLEKIGVYWGNVWRNWCSVIIILSRNRSWSSLGEKGDFLGTQPLNSHVLKGWTVRHPVAFLSWSPEILLLRKATKKHLLNDRFQIIFGIN